jgi:CRISPR-associated protein Cas2
MEILLTYDVRTSTPHGQRRLRRMAALCEGYGTRVQKSVFEIICTDAQLVTLLHQAQAIARADEDSIRVYHVPAGTFTKATMIGTASNIPHRDPLIL